MECFEWNPTNGEHIIILVRVKNSLCKNILLVLRYHSSNLFWEKDEI